MHELFPPPKEEPDPLMGASDSRDWVTHVQDMNGDGWPDVVEAAAPYHAVALAYYENPGKPAVDAPKGSWKRVDIGQAWFEHRPFVDVSGDGKPDILCAQGKRMGFYDSSRAWKAFVTVEPNGTWDATTHGLGAGDVDGDGVVDVLHARAWYSRSGSGWTRHPFDFQPAGLLPASEPGGKPYHSDGGAEMFGYDVDGDGDTDVIASLDAHGWGLAWFEQRKVGSQISFVPHKLMGTDAEKAKYGGIAYSQLHALQVTDMDGDGLADIVSGKSFKAHPKATLDPDVNGEPVLYIWKLTRGPDGATFVPHLVGNDVGVGRQFSIGDVNGDGLPDIAISCRLGAHVFLQQPM